MTTEADRFRELHRYVRLITPLPAVWLLVAIAVVWVVRRELFESISDYYGGPLRDVFVGALMAGGVCMVVYKGRSEAEDYALNFAGVNAFFVALVPNSFPEVLEAARASEAAGLRVLVTGEQLLQNLKIAVGVFVVIAAAFAVVDARLIRRTRFRIRDQTPLSTRLLALSWVAELALLGVVLGMLLGVETLLGVSIFSVVHVAAAVLLVLDLSFAAASHAFPATLRTTRDESPAAPAYLRVFRAITVAMWAGIAVGGAAFLADVPYAILWTEVWEFVLFIVFWFCATTRDWGGAVRRLVGRAPAVR